MNKSKLSFLGNILWFLAIVIALVAVLFGFFFAAFTRNNGDREATTLNLESLNIKDEGTSVSIPDSSSSIGNPSSSGNLLVLGETADAGDDYLRNLTFLCDSSLIALRDNSLISSRVWGSESGTLNIASTGTWNIVFSDGSKISPDTAVMIQKPEILVIAIGNDGLAATTQAVFIENYSSLIQLIRSQSPSTKIVCCSVIPVTDSYPGTDGLTNRMTETATEWVKLVCSENGTYYCDIAAAVTVDTSLAQQYADIDGKSLNIEGIQAVLSYLRVHAIS